MLNEINSTFKIQHSKFKKVQAIKAAFFNAALIACIFLKIIVQEFLRGLLEQVPERLKAPERVQKLQRERERCLKR